MKDEKKERRYESWFPPYEPSKQFDIYFINTATTNQEINYLINLVQAAKDFVIDTESDIHSNLPSLIQILVFEPNQITIPVILVETSHLPDFSSLCFHELQELFHYLFSSMTNLYSWGPLRDELDKFQIHKLFQNCISSKIFNVQKLFTHWFNLYIKENNNADNSLALEMGDSLLINAPELDLELFVPPADFNKIKMNKNQLWSLQDSIAYIFYQYLSKRDTLRSWSIGLDEKLQHRNKNYSLAYRNRLIKYAAYDCLSLVDLMLFMYNNYLANGSGSDVYMATLGEYFSFLQNKFPSPSSSIVKKQPSLSASIFFDTDDDSDDMLTVHELNEQQRSSLHHPVGQQLTTADPTIIEATSTTNSPPTQQLSTTVEFSTSVPVENQPNHPPTQQLSTTVEFSTSLPVENQPNHPPQASIKLKRKIRRSAQAQKKRNQKSNSRHRRNRYIYEIQRQINMDVTTIKNILDLYNIKYTNVNPVKNIIYIGVKSEQEQQHYEQLLPVDIFL